MENESNFNTAVFQGDDELSCSFSLGLEFLAPKATNNNNGAAPTPRPSRFATVSEHEMQQILSERHSESTKKTTNWSVGTFKGKYLRFNVL